MNHVINLENKIQVTQPIHITPFTQVILTEDKTHINPIIKIYDDYSKIFNSNFIILKIDTENFHAYLNESYDISNLNEFNFVKTNFLFYETTEKISLLYEKIPLLLQKKYSVIVINKDNNIIAIHHPANTHNKINMSFAFIL
jgi:hypothetical protein